MNSELKGTETIGVTDEVRFNMRVDNRGPEGMFIVPPSPKQKKTWFACCLVILSSFVWFLLGHQTAGLNDVLPLSHDIRRFHMDYISRQREYQLCCGPDKP